MISHWWHLLQRNSFATLIRDTQIITKKLTKGDEPLPHTVYKNVSGKLLGIIWSAKGHSITDTVRKQPLTFSAPASWKQAKHLLDMLGFWRQYIPYLKISFKPTWCCYLQISSSWMGLHPTKDSTKQQVLPLASSRDPFTVEVLATSSHAFWSLWTTHDVQKLFVQKNTCFWCWKRLSLSYTPWDQLSNQTREFVPFTFNNAAGELPSII